MRNRKRLLAITTWAMTSCAASLALLGPAMLQATDPVGPRAENSWPSLDVQGLTLSMRIAGGSDAKTQPITMPAGKTVALELIAINTTDQPATLPASVFMNASSAPSNFSRTPSLPKEVWREQETITLAPHESRTIALSPAVPMQAGSNVSVGLVAADKSLFALRWSVPSGVAAADPVASR